MGELVNQQQAFSPEQLLDRTVILELDALTQQDKIFFIEALLLWIHHFRMTEATRETFKHAILIEEAHHVLSDERRSLVGGQSVMEITFREIREFGESLILLDQHPSQISLPALGNTYCTICLNLKHSKDVNAMAQCMLLQGDEKDILGSLEVGQAVVKLQGRIPRPFLIKIPEFEVQKGSISDNAIRLRMEPMLQQLGVQQPAMPSVQPHRPCCDNGSLHQPAPAPSKPSTSSDNLEQRFLKDVQDHPDSGIAERYKRLGISVRQGQKVKAKLVEAAFIEEREEITPQGRIRRIRLTEKEKKLPEQNKV